jgi:hypothetical protein
VNFWIIAIVFGILLTAPVADARCGKPPRFLTDEYLRGWDIVAYGTVTEVHNDSSARHESFAVFTLEGAWQGDPPNPLRVYHSDSAHGYQFNEGESYLVFASRSNDRIIASICGPTCRGPACLRHMELLGEPMKRY